MSPPARRCLVPVPGPVTMAQHAAVLLTALCGAQDMDARPAAPSLRSRQTCEHAERWSLITFCDTRADDRHGDPSDSTCPRTVKTDDETRTGSLRPMLHIDWRRLPDFPAQGTVKSGLEASNGGWVSSSEIVSAFGYAGGGSHNFMNSTWLLNISAVSGSKSEWQRLPDAPVAPRQDVGSTVIGGALYFIGGFSYSQPFTYNDVMRLQRDSSGTWAWSILPAFPHPIDAYSGLVSIGKKLFVFGGAYYNATGFYSGARGKQLYCLDTQDLSAGWTRLPDLPSTGRWIASVSAIGTNIFVIGGATGSNPQHPITTLVDNWKYDTVAQRWLRLTDLPIASGNFGSDSVFMGRYIILIGGFQYDQVTLRNGTNVPSYGKPQRMCNRAKKGATHCRPGCPALETKIQSNEYFNDVWAYDTRTDRFGTVTASSTGEPCLLPSRCGSYPLNNNVSLVQNSAKTIFVTRSSGILPGAELLKSKADKCGLSLQVPQTNILGNQIFTVGGEADVRTICGEEYQHYPRLAVLGTIRVAQTRDPV
eukprot:SAG31_NODE_4554_length_3143_cov_24.683640_2_plen_534_part_00